MQAKYIPWQITFNVSFLTGHVYDYKESAVVLESLHRYIGTLKTIHPKMLRLLWRILDLTTVDPKVSHLAYKVSVLD